MSLLRNIDSSEFVVIQLLATITESEGNESDVIAQ